MKYTCENSFEPKGEYSIIDGQLTVGPGRALRLSCKVLAPEGETVCVRSWASNEDCTLDEDVAANSEVEIELDVPADKALSGEYIACLRLESAPLKTEHTVHVNFTFESDV
ncbi:MAG: hypothetical protein HRU15_08055 [Planctomycetes bacterium]|nr:hypothetical protein [Planctomycetota bacterium]